MSVMSAGARLRQAVSAEKPLQVVGAINAYVALLAERVGFRALYLSGAGVANASYGLPDLGITTLQDVLTDAQRITATTELPLLVDVDTGWGSAFNLKRMVHEMERAGVAGIQIEDQVQAKRCGHRPNKKIVSTQEMVDRIKVAVDARRNDDFVIMARTDAFANEGLEASVERAQAYLAAGADMLFPEAITTLEDYKPFTQLGAAPVLANITEFGRTPLFTREQLAQVGVGLALYPLSAFRAMNAAALRVYETIRQQGTQASVVDEMQTREALYDFLGYHEYEQALNALFEDDRGT